MSDENSYQTNSFLLREVKINRYLDVLNFLVFFAAFFFLTPVVDFGDAQITAMKVPLQFMLIFGCWGILIFAVFLTNRFLKKQLAERKL